MECLYNVHKLKLLFKFKIQLQNSHQTLIRFNILYIFNLII